MSVPGTSPAPVRSPLLYVPFGLLNAIIGDLLNLARPVFAGGPGQDFGLKVATCVIRHITTPVSCGRFMSIATVQDIGGHRSRSHANQLPRIGYMRGG